MIQFMNFELPRSFPDKGKENLETEQNYATSIEALPSLRADFLRLTHITAPEAAQQIIQSGLNYESQGMISSTTRVYSKESDVEYSTTDPRFGQKGMKVVVMDMPVDEYKLHNDPTRSPGIVSPKFIVGVVDVQKPEKK